MSTTFLYTLALVKTALSITLLSIMGFEDIRTREVSSGFVFTYLGLSIPLFAISSFYYPLPALLKVVYVVASMTATAGVPYLLNRARLIGEGDLFVSIALGLLYPYPDVYVTTLVGSGILPPSLAIMLYSAVASVLLSAYNFIVSLKHTNELRSLRGIYKLLVPFLARPVKVKDYVTGKYKHSLPIQHFRLEGDGKVSRYFKLLARVNESSENTVRELYNRGILNENTLIWVTPGLPFIFFFLTGLLLFLVVGDKPIIAVINFLVTFL